MDKSDKQRTLGNLSESELRTEVIMPLLSRMGYRAVMEYHGPRELGKDIVCYDIDRLRKRRYLAVVAKVTDLTGSVSSNRGLLTVCNQIEQCFNEEYSDLFGMRKITMDEVWVVTAGKIVSGAADSVIDKLQKSNLSKLTSFIAIEELVELIDEYLPTYWNLEGDTPDQVRGQRDRLLALLQDLLSGLGASKTKISEVVSAVMNSKWSPSVYRPDKSWRIGHTSAYSIDLTKSSIAYPAGLSSDQCGDIQRAFYSAKESVRNGLYALEDIIDVGEKALLTSDPNEFLSIFNDSLIDEPPFNKSYGYSDVVMDISYFEEGVADIDSYLVRLESAGKRERVLRLIESLESHEEVVAEYLSGVVKEEFSLTWQIDGDEIKFLYDSSLEEKVDGFTTSHELQIPTFNRFGGPKTRRVTSRKLIDTAQLALREHIEKSLPPEQD